MSTTTSCPDSAQLLRLIDGELPQAEQAELTRHLDGCPRCQRAVEELASGGRSWSEMAAHLGAEQPGGDYEPALSRAVRELAGGDPDPTRADATTADEPAAGDDGLSFLVPSDKPGHLGRLDHYEVLEVVGRGGMGVVLRAFDEKLHRVVAIKALAPQLATSATARKRFLREALAAAAVAHEHVVAIHAVEEHGPVPYLVMQFVAGMSLEDRIRQGAPLEVKEVLRVGMQAASGLAAAHAQGLVHRDVKPANILLENGVQRVKLTDFGLARAADDASLTQSGVIAGTPLFMSPEQARGEPVDARSDLFSLGSVLYTMCTGRPPFRARNTMAVLKRVCDDTPRPPGEINPDVPDWLAAIVLKLLAKDPAQRFQTAAEVADLLGQHLAHLQQPHLVARPPSVVAPERPPRLPLGSVPLPGARTALLGMSGCGVVWGVLCIVVGLILTFVFCAGLYMALRQRPPDAPRPQGAGPQGGGGDEQKALLPRPPAPEELAKLPSPLDGRRREDIPKELLALAGGDQAPAELVAILGGKAGPAREVWTVAFSPDGKTLASAGQGGTIRLWDLAGWKPDEPLPPVRTLSGHTDTVWSVAFCPDGKLLASGGYDGAIILWDVAAGQKVRTLVGPAKVSSVVAFSPDGKVLATGQEDGTVRRWDVSAGAPQEPLHWHNGMVVAVAFSPDGRLLASKGRTDVTVCLADAATGQLLGKFHNPNPGHTNLDLGLAFSPDSRALAFGGENEVRVCDIEAREETVLRGHTARLRGLAFHPNGRLFVTAAADRTVRLWDRSRPGAARTIGPGPFGEMAREVTFDPTGRYLATSNWNGTVTVFRLANRGEMPQLPAEAQ
jgi:anti-sigma factor RsiW